VTAPPVESMATSMVSVDPSVAYLLRRVAVLEGRVRSLVAARRRDDPTPDDPFRGLYFSTEHVELMLAAGTDLRVIEWDDTDSVSMLEAAADQAEADGAVIRLRALSRRAGLDELDLDLLLIAMAPDLDCRFERLYGYLNNDVTRRRATVALGLELAGASPWSVRSRARLTADAALLSSGLVVVEEPERPLLTRSIRVPDRVTSHLLGDDRPDPAVAGVVRSPVAATGAESFERSVAVASVLRQGVDLLYVKERAGSSAAALAEAALRGAGFAALTVDLEHLGSSDDITAVAKLAWREALLAGAGLVVGPVEAVADRGGAAAVRALTDSTRADRAQDLGRPPVILHGHRGWEPSWSRLVPLVVEAISDTTAERAGQWATHLGPDAPPRIEDSDVATQFMLSADQVARAVESARLQARLDGRPVDVNHLRAGARAQNGAGLERLARRIRPAVGWDDLVLAPTTSRTLHELAGRARKRDLVLDEWGLRPGGGRGRGITVLFAGDSGTGKTMSAEVVAGDLGLDLYTVNLATVVDKYVGETEKNLERIFTEADGVNAVLLFDEADALFGKRSEVRDANDRYANIEVAYLLQRMETFDGIAILATNLRANVDDAFARRLDLVVDFPSPDVELRRALWERCLPAGVPRSGDIDLEFCAQSFELSGGNIRNVAITAAYLAADEGRAVAMADLVRAIQQEYRKLGRLIVAKEFGAYVTPVGP